MHRKALVALWLVATAACVDSPMVDDDASNLVRMEADEVSMDGEWSGIRFKWGLPYLLEGQTRYVDAVVLDALGRDVEDLPVEFIAGDPTLIDVQPDGAVTGLRAGAVDVIARYGQLETRLQVGVESAAAETLQVSTDYVVMTWLEEAEVFATAYNERDRMLDAPLEWKSLDLAVATVDAGHIQPVAPGYTHIEVSSGQAIAVVRVRVVAPPAAYVEVLDCPRYLDVGDRDAVTAAVLAADRRVIEGAVIEFESLQPSVLWIEPDTGRVKALAEGLAKITARSGDAWTNCQISIRPAAPN